MMSVIRLVPQLSFWRRRLHLFRRWPRNGTRIVPPAP